MPVNFDDLSIFSRPYLADLWSDKGFQEVSRGVVTPPGTSIIILLVTNDKQSSLTQYSDYINGNLLHFEGKETP